ncbi:hypothetical protein LT85_2431 [Collimonas arenae]|uniref:Uncharacterized protein n=1 Tax=Collimonas arenae TaxID=279058 RepID=A0A0A1FD34_9BURK|nr:hypothetical protein [Collimonas arenae]AIY41589.1 hypothetical protein LT85_2431 [Collimonas arenae]
MLRTALLGFAILLTCAGIFCSVRGTPGAFPLTTWGLILLVAVLIERWRYTRRHTADEGPWQETGERFVDPESGRLMRVLYSPSSGERRYVAVGENPDIAP